MSNKSIKKKYSSKSLKGVPTIIKKAIQEPAKGLKTRSLIYINKPCEKGCLKEDILKINKKLELLQKTDEKGYINWKYLKETLDNLKCHHNGGNQDLTELSNKLNFIMERLNSIEKIQITGEAVDRIRSSIVSSRKGKGNSIDKKQLENFSSNLKLLQEKLDKDILERRKNENKFNELKLENDVKDINRDLNYKNLV